MSQYTGSNWLLKILFKKDFFIATIYFKTRPPVALDNEVDLSYDAGTNMVLIQSDDVPNPFQQNDKDPQQCREVKYIPESEFLSIDYLYKHSIIQGPNKGKLIV